VSDNQKEWINCAARGDEHAFGFLIDQYQKPVFSLCYRMLGNYHDAEDAAQESFIKAFYHIKKYDSNRPFGTWLLSITAHHCIDYLRKRRLPTVSIEALPTEIIPDERIPSPELSLRQAEWDAQVMNLIMDLKPLDRATIILRYWHECSEVEIAETLNLSVSAVKSRLYRSRQTLAKSWLEMEKGSMPKERRPYESPAI